MKVQVRGNESLNHGSEKEETDLEDIQQGGAGLGPAGRGHVKSDARR